MNKKSILVDTSSGFGKTVKISINTWLLYNFLNKLRLWVGDKQDVENIIVYHFECYSQNNDVAMWWKSKNWNAGTNGK